MLRKVMITSIFFLGGFSLTSLASVGISVMPLDGSNSLRFEGSLPLAAGNKQQIHVRVNSNGGRYQVFQNMLEPMTNEKGEILNLQAIQAQTMPNSNTAGTLYLQNSDRLSMGDQLLYSSSPQGQSDGFIVGYGLVPGLVSGTYRGRLAFTVRGSDGTSDQVSIDVYINVASSLKVSIKGGHNPNRLHVHGTDTAERSADFISVSFSGNAGGQIQIYQEVDQLPQNAGDEELKPDLLQLDAQGANQAVRLAPLSRLNSGRTLVYSGSASQDNFVIYFLADSNAVEHQEAGTYTGRIKYIVETPQGTQEFPMTLQCDIAPVFSMTITTPPGGVSFTHVIPNSPPQDKEVVVTVLSNLHKPYQVLQDIPVGLTNEQGKEFNTQYFMVQVEIPEGQRGQTDFTEFAPVKTGEYPIFSSDAAGNGTTFKVLYRLQGYNQMNPGNFQAPIRLSLNQK